MRRAGFRFFSALVVPVLLIGLVVSPSAAQEVTTVSPAEARAAQELAELKRLHAAGAVSRKRVEEAEAALTQSKDEATLAATLYADLPLAELTEEAVSQMKQAAQRRLDRKEEHLAEAARLVAAGVKPRASLTEYEDEVARARHELAAAEERARTVSELASMVKAEEEAASEAEAPAMQGPMPVMTRYAGPAAFNDRQLARIVVAFERQFDRKLPISAHGQTALHRSMGFDHRGRVDVGLNPDDAEGRWLMAHLEKSGIPYFAFRYQVPGKSTAPHIHIGPPSLRVRIAD